MIVPCIVSSSLYELRTMRSSFGRASCARMSPAIAPPTTKNTSDVAMYRIPIRLWSTVAIQLAMRPRVHGTLYVGGSARTATGAPELLGEVRGQCVHLGGAPALPDRGHRVPAVPHDV